MLARTKQLALVLVFTLALQNSAFAFPATDTAQPASQDDKVRTEIQKHVTNKKQVKVTLRSGGEIKGFVSRSDDASFDLTEKKRTRIHPELWGRGQSSRWWSEPRCKDRDRPGWRCGGCSIGVRDRA